MSSPPSRRRQRPEDAGKVRAVAGGFGPWFQDVEDVASAATVSRMDYLKVNALQPTVFQQIVPQTTDVYGENVAFQLGLVAGMNPGYGVNGKGQCHYRRPP